jgi:hypothetical protein
MTTELGENEVAQVLSWVGMSGELQQDLQASRQSDHARSEMKRHRTPVASRAVGQARLTLGNKSKSGIKG